MPKAFRPLVGLAPSFRSREAPAPTTPPRGERVARVGLLLGCVQREVFGDVNTASARVLAADGFEVVSPVEQGCCGALAIHAGRREDGKARARTLIETFERANVDLIVTNAAGCGSSVKEYGRLLGDDPAWAERAAAFSGRVRDISELLAERGPQAERHPLGALGRVPGLVPPPARPGRAERAARRALGDSRASSCASPPIRRSAAAAPASTTWCSPRRRPSSARRRRRRCSPRARGPTPARTRAA